MKLLPLTTLALAALAAGCSERSEASSPVADESAPTSTAAQTDPHGTSALDPPAAADLQGTVKETMNSGGYTYVLVDNGTEEVWAVGPPFEVAVGDEVRVSGTMPMPGYHSNTLDRTFDMVLFAQSIAPVGQAAAAGGMPPGHAGLAKKAAGEIDFAGLEPVEGGATVEQVFRNRDELVGTEIALRAKVVKYNGGILGKNWLHVRDGTGSEGANDLTITTDATCAVGDTVLVRGTLVADRDFGSGYSYDLIVEDAQVTVE